MGAWFRWIKKLYQNLNEKLEGVKAGVQGVGNTYFVDGIDGLNTNDGLTRDRPLLTIAAALLKCVDDHDDYIVVLVGDGASETFPIDINVRRVHIIGVSNKGAPQTRVGIVATGNPVFTISADNCEIAGLMLMSDATHSAIRFLTQGWGTWIHHCTIGAVINTQDGINAAGEAPVGGLIEDNIFADCIQRYGIHLAGPTRCVIRNNYFREVANIAILLAGGEAGAVIGNFFYGQKALSLADGWAINMGGVGALIMGNLASETGDNSGNNPYKDSSVAGVGNKLNGWCANYKGNALSTGPAD